MSYETVARFAQHFGPIYFGLIFLVAVVYALWPKNDATFRQAARLPLQQDDEA